MRLGLICMVFLGSLLVPSQAEAQSLLERYRQARFQAEADRLMRVRGLRPETLPPAHLPGWADTLTAFYNRHQEQPVIEPPPPPPFEGARWRPLRRLERRWFERNFESTAWSFLGNTLFTRLDTTLTRELRARLEGRFGPPTLTLVEAQDSTTVSSDRYIQFEYWMLVNETIPLRIMDVGGPLDRGLIIASDQQLRSQLHDLRTALELELYSDTVPTAYQDYYYDQETRNWYLTGFDGSRYFTRRTSRPRLTGRPLLLQGP